MSFLRIFKRFFFFLFILFFYVIIPFLLPQPNVKLNYNILTIVHYLILGFISLFLIVLRDS